MAHKSLHSPARCFLQATMNVCTRATVWVIWLAASRKAFANMRTSGSSSRPGISCHWWARQKMILVPQKKRWALKIQLINSNFITVVESTPRPLRKSPVTCYSTGHTGPQRKNKYQRRANSWRQMSIVAFCGKFSTSLKAQSHRRSSRRPWERQDCPGTKFTSGSTIMIPC